MEKLTVTKKQSFKKTITAPPSKSYSHRMILSASLANGVSQIENVLFSKDINATLDCAKNFGANVFTGDDFVKITSGGKTIKEGEFFCNESGSTLRFIIPILAAMGIKARVFGSKTLMERPLDVYTDLFCEHNMDFEYKKGEYFDVLSPLIGGEYNIRGDISSQFLTGLLYALPLCNKDSKINITTSLLSKPYIDITLDVLKKSGIEIENDNYKTFKIKKNQKFSPINAPVPGDFSQSCAFIAAAVFNGEIELLNLDAKSVQGDKKVIEYTKALGGNIEVFDNKIKIKKSDLKSNLTFDISDCPDIAPVFSVICAHAEGETILKGTKRLKIKECDRESAIVKTLNKLGVKTIAGDDFIKIYGSQKPFKGGEFETFNDHRMAMALSSAAIVTDGKIILDDSKCVDKSYPTFYNDFNSFCNFNS
ncbi:MAG: 3-phosphoshikimate 1-carboxyvinyltransferase [Ruminococcaceae bacterium]|nr:3-phosphoshikimate 1-carboxyvinyltransferase [Oscillospiraceae bacterium]